MARDKPVYLTACFRGLVSPTFDYKHKPFAPFLVGFACEIEGIGKIGGDGAFEHLGVNLYPAGVYCIVDASVHTESTIVDQRHNIIGRNAAIVEIRRVYHKAATAVGGKNYPGNASKGASSAAMSARATWLAVSVMPYVTAPLNPLSRSRAIMSARGAAPPMSNAPISAGV